MGLKVKKSTEELVSTPVAGVYGIVGGLLAAVFCPPLAIPMILGSAVLGKAVGNAAVRKDLDDDVPEDAARRVFDAWLDNREEDEQGISVSHTLGSGGALIDLPMTRTYTLTDDDDPE